jgi:hypothetical protein
LSNIADKCFPAKKINHGDTEITERKRRIAADEFRRACTRKNGFLGFFFSVLSVPPW